ncbi:MAG: galactokinase [Planctomycetes bacterium]|nr:galactokinase [Planctomycetota bacterium]
MDSEIANEMLAGFKRTFGAGKGLSLARAPGRVNLIGEHTDYSGGFVLPMAVDREVRLLFRPVQRGPVRLWGENVGQWDEFDLDDIARSAERGWANYARGVALMLQRAGYALGPIEGVIYGDVPLGAGLSSSAALEVAAARAFCAAAGEGPAPRELALLCQKAENEFVGVNCGIMDQFVSVHARAGHALLLDCRSLEHEHLPLDTGEVRVVVCNTMVDHELAASAYNERRDSCERAARLLGRRAARVRQLRDVTPEMLRRHGDVLDGPTRKRARHVVTENARTLSAAEALKRADYETFGRLMDESHESLRDDYEVSCEELDVMVQVARSLDGVLGARMVGAGFGGCTVNLVRRARLGEFINGMELGYRARTGISPDIYECVPAGGARVEAV